MGNLYTIRRTTKELTVIDALFATIRVPHSCSHRSKFKNQFRFVRRRWNILQRYPNSVLRRKGKLSQLFIILYTLFLSIGANANTFLYITNF